MPEYTAPITITWVKRGCCARSPCDQEIGVSDSYSFDARTISSGGDQYWLYIRQGNQSTTWQYPVADYPDGENTFVFPDPLPGTGLGEYEWRIAEWRESNNSLIATSVWCAFTIVERDDGVCTPPEGPLFVGGSWRWSPSTWHESDDVARITPPDSDAGIDWGVDDLGNVSATPRQAGTWRYSYSVELNDGTEITCQFEIEVLPAGVGRCGPTCAVADASAPVTVSLSQGSSGPGTFVFGEGQIGPGTWELRNGYLAIWTPDGLTDSFVGVAIKPFRLVDEIAGEQRTLCCGEAKVLVLPATGVGTDHCAIIPEASLCGDRWDRIGDITSISYAGSHDQIQFRDLLSRQVRAEYAGWSSHTINLSLNYEPRSLTQTILGTASGFYLRLWTVPEDDPSGVRPMVSARVLPSNVSWSRDGGGKKKHAASVALTVDGDLITENAWS